MEDRHWTPSGYHEEAYFFPPLCMVGNDKKQPLLDDEKKPKFGGDEKKPQFGGDQKKPA